MCYQRILLVGLAGASGGALRGLMGIANRLVNTKYSKVNWPWFFTSVFVSAIVGIIAASFFGDDLRLAVLAGYAGADFIEGLIKIKLKNRFSGEDKEEVSGFGKLIKKAK